MFSKNVLSLKVSSFGLREEFNFNILKFHYISNSFLSLYLFLKLKYIYILINILIRVNNSLKVYHRINGKLLYK